MPSESAAFQLGLGFCGGFPDARGRGGPFLVAGVGGFELLAFGGDLAGERLRVRGLGWSCRVAASAACCQVSASAWAVSRSWAETSGGALAWARSASRTRASSSPLGQAADDVGLVADFQGADGGLPHVLEFGVAAVRAGCDGLLGVGDPGGFAVGRGGRGSPGVLLAQGGEAPGARTPRWRASHGSGLAASWSPSARARASSPAASSWATAGALAGVRWAHVTSWPEYPGRGMRCRRPCRTLAMDRAPSIGAAVIWSMIALMSCPASWAARSCCWRAWREGSRWYRQASDSVSLAVICWSMRVEGLPDGGGPQGEQVAGSAGPVLGLADLLGGGQVAVVAAHDAGEDGFRGGLLVGRVAGWCGAAGDDVGGVGLAAAGHADVQGLPGQRVGDQEVGGVDGAALGDVDVAGVVELGVWSPGRPGRMRNMPVQVPSSRSRRTSASRPQKAVIWRMSRLVRGRPSAVDGAC